MKCGGHDTTGYSGSIMSPSLLVLIPRLVPTNLQYKAIFIAINTITAAYSTVYHRNASL